MAQIFNTRHGLEVKDEAESAALAAQMAQAFEAAGLSEEPEEDAREERVFRCVRGALRSRVDPAGLCWVPSHSSSPLTSHLPPPASSPPHPL